jgi:carboxymethylenebutenolidase
MFRIEPARNARSVRRHRHHGFCLGGRMVVKTAARHEVACAVSYYGVGIEDCLDLVDDIRCPMVLHFAELDSSNPPVTVERIRQGFAGNKSVTINVYAGVDHAFASAGRPPYDKPAAMMAYSRSLALFRKVLGPEYDLSALWDKHLEYEFASRDLEANMKTMVAQPCGTGWWREADSNRWSSLKDPL